MDTQAWVTTGVAIVSIAVTAATAIYALHRQARSHADELAANEREARVIARYDAAVGVAARIMDVLVQMDRVRLTIWPPDRWKTVDDHTRAETYRQFREFVPTLMAAVRIARLVPLSDEAVACLNEVDAAILGLPEREDTFQELGRDRERLNDAFDEFVVAVSRMAPGESGSTTA